MSFRVAITRAWPETQAAFSIEVIVMTTSLREALGRSARALRKMHEEQVYAWERLFRVGLPPQPDEAPRAQVPRPRPASR